MGLRGKAAVRVVLVKRARARVGRRMMELFREEVVDLNERLEEGCRLRMSDRCLGLRCIVVRRTRQKKPEREPILYVIRSSHLLSAKREDGWGFSDQPLPSITDDIKPALGV